VADPDHIHDALPIINTIHDSVVTNADAPQILFAVEFAGSARPWLLGEFLNPGDDPRGKR